MKAGEVIWAAAWLTGEETPAQRQAYEDRVAEAMDELCHDKGLHRGDAQFYTRKPGEPNVPEVPDHIQGFDVQILIGEATILGPALKPRGFIGDLDTVDLERLRVITRRQYEQKYPGRTLSDAECDEVIEEIGPEAAMDAVRRAYNSGAVN